MNVASLNLCKELYELSGWTDGANLGEWIREEGESTFFVAPKYDLGYLLRKLPRQTPSGCYLALQPSFDDEWFIGYMAYGEPELYSNYATKPEDAACKLAIELFKQGVMAAASPQQEPNEESI